jgi:hypothetical protein
MARRAIDPQRHLDLLHEVELVVAGGSPQVLDHDDPSPRRGEAVVAAKMYDKVFLHA